MSEKHEILQSSEKQVLMRRKVVWNENYNSALCRIASNPSHPTASGWSLNDMLAKDKNNMNKLVEIIICWSINRVVIHTDIKKIYNSLKLQKEDWCLQR